MNLCPNCKSPIPPEVNRFCNQCGFEITGVAQQPVDRPRLIGILPTGEKTEYRLDGLETAIGKATHNQIVLADPTVSGSHALISSVDGGFNLLDLASSNGTWVNGKRLTNRSHRLQHGDRIGIGRLTLTFRDPDIELSSRTAGLTSIPNDNSSRDERNETRGMVAGLPAERTITVNLPRDLRRAIVQEKKARANSKPLNRKRDRYRMKMVLLNSLSRIISTLIGAAVTIAIALYLVRRFQPSLPTGSGSPGAQAVTEARVTTIIANGPWVDFDTGLLGERLEASGIASRPGASGLLVASDREAGRIAWMDLDESGKQRGPLVSLRLDSYLSSPTGLTYGNSCFYLLGSQSDPVDPRQHTLVRFDFDPTTRELRGPVETIGNLRDFLIDSIPEITQIGRRPGSVGGLSTGGLAWDPNGERLLIGLRSPLIGGQSVIIPLRFTDPRGSFQLENIRLADPRLIILPLDGQEIRDLTYDPHLKNFLILSGPPEDRPIGDFILWEWSGQLGSPPRRIMALDGEMKPVAMTSLTLDHRNFLMIVGDGAGDGGHYLELTYQ